MTLYLLQNSAGDRREICSVPSAIMGSSMGLARFLRHHADKVFGGKEGRDWRICHDPKALVPLSVNQLISGIKGEIEYGQQLIIT